MGPKGVGRQLPEATRKKIANAMAAGGGGFGQIPSGFTYLGQFIDHDLTADRTAVTLDTHVAPSELLQGRSPALDLDSLYGAGPQDPESARFYEGDGLHLKMGKTVAAGGDAAMDGFDLPRGAGATAKAKRKAVIPDHRNDENLAVAQTHLAFIRFHNRVVDSLPASVPAGQRFARARRVVTKHYQWMIRTDYLPRICAKGVVNQVFNNGRKAFEVGAAPTDVPTMPIEFSVAAFRLGHAMIRRSYTWTAASTTEPARSTSCSRSRAPAVTSSANRGCRATGSRTSAGCMTSRRPEDRTSRCRRASSTAPRGSTRRSSTR